MICMYISSIIFHPSTYKTSYPRVIGDLSDIYRYCLTRVRKKYFHINSGNENETFSIFVALVTRTVLETSHADTWCPGMSCRSQCVLRTDCTLSSFGF